MRCVLDHKQCLYEQCRYFIKNFCVLTNIDRSGWPSPDERLKKNEYVGAELQAKNNSSGEE